jgi:two-component SAPR family response regulator
MNDKRIIIVEDQPIVALDFQILMKNNGFNNSFCFAAGGKALENINKIKPDLAILDIKLKDQVTGINIAEHLHKLGVPFIFVSAFSNHENYKKAVALNPARIFHKPIDHKSLLNAVNEIFSLKTTL